MAERNHLGPKLFGNHALYIKECAYQCSICRKENSILIMEYLFPRGGRMIFMKDLWPLTEHFVQKKHVIGNARRS